jgi:hypothetical protein
MAAKAHAALTNANFPLDPEGRTMHLNIKKGDGILIEFVNRFLYVLVSRVVFHNFRQWRTALCLSALSAALKN